ncbi:MAG: phosphoheptose isomerase [Rhodospirillaceae bacterium]|nr:phosphoheptose isomerase [Alphaproteobacteria bacterium]MBR72935.1 phosphoheptose isomerase [Rhodospirillaceae bacterium]|tara:strand:- start:600 stop:1220 length:621 start_codon:yes stop_codon:yes gene_type:complete
MTFPNKQYTTIASFIDDYVQQLSNATASINRDKLTAAAKIINDCINQRNWIYTCGNGGSASIANHLLCDYAKCIQTDTTAKPRVVSLSANLEIITAIANDIEYEECFVYQLQTSAQTGDVLVTISASGDSENVVRALNWASRNGLHTISLTGFDGGRSAKIADINLHVNGDNYGVIEDTHQSIMHIIAQYIRQNRMHEKVISKRKF